MGTLLYLCPAEINEREECFCSTALIKHNGVAGKSDCSTLFISKEDRLQLYSCPLSVLMARVSSAGLMHMVSIFWLSARLSSLLYGSEGIWRKRMHTWSLWNTHKACSANVSCIFYLYLPDSSVIVLLLLFKKTDCAGAQRACKALGIGQNCCDARCIGIFVRVSVFDLFHLKLSVKWINELKYSEYTQFNSWQQIE